MTIEKAINDLGQVTSMLIKDLGTQSEKIAALEKTSSITQKTVTNLVRSIENLNDKAKNLSDRLYFLEKRVKKIMKKKSCNELE